ncbi:hypothetical protein [Stenotrophomonas phage BUCT609]|uniref:Uncharacterized protein n=1 Tax=Stenotrophomonas phage BUCT609 TaxID=2834250 RepID=A0A8E6PM13_9CAUD|nr:hypothetical protein [Stenotrophomonas phage BUCT609]
MHAAGVSMRDCRLSVQSAVLNWDLEHSKNPERILHEVRQRHVKEAAELIVKRHTIEQFESPDTLIGERYIRTSCIVMSLADFEKVVNNEVEYRMSRLRPMNVMLHP